MTSGRHKNKNGFAPAPKHQKRGKLGDKRKFSAQGFTLIELLVAIFILSIVLVGMVSVFVSSAEAYTKARAIKYLTDNVQFALASVTKDIRMGRIESSDANCTGTGAVRRCLMVTRNAT